MPTFQITGPDGKKYRVTGDSPDGALRALQTHVGGQAKPEGESQSFLGGMTDAFTQGASMGFGDELTAAEAALLGRTPEGGWFDYSGSMGDRYNTALEAERAQNQKFSEEHPVASAGGQIAGGLGVGLGAGRAGLTLMKGGQSLPAAMGVGAAEGAGYGAAAGAGYADGGVKDRIKGALTGGAMGGAAGASLPPVLAAGGSVAKSIGGMLGAGNQSRANSAIAEAIARSGRSLDDVTDDMTRARADGQGEYMLADALGNPGRRMMTGVVRSPGDARTKIVDALQRRQAGQSDRLINALSEGFDAPDTAAQRAGSLKSLRKSQADTNYMLARDGAGTVDPSAAIAAADDFLSPGVNRIAAPQSGIADDSIEAAVRKARSYLTDDKSVVSDFNVALRAKQELDNLIDGAKPGVQRQLIPIRNALDDALEQASPDYAAARDTFRQQSRAIDAVDLGKTAATRGRSENNIDAFSRLDPDARSAFRAGYADPLIERVEKSALSPTTNKARPLITAKTGAEFPEFAAPGRADQLGDRISREARMFETANAALGGSKTADNLADIMDIQTFDPTMMGALATGNVKGAVLHALTKSGNVLQGRNQKVRDLIADALLQTDPSKATASLASAVRKGETLTKQQQALIRALSAQAGAQQPF